VVAPYAYGGSPDSHTAQFLEYYGGKYTRQIEKQVLPLNAIGRGTTAPTPGTSMGTHGDMMGNHPADKPIRAGCRPIIRWLLHTLMENLLMHLLYSSWNTMEANTPAKLKNKYCS